MVVLIVIIIAILLGVVLRKAFQTRCPNCGRFFAIEKYAGGEEVKSFTRNKLGIQSGFIGTDLKFKGAAVGKTPENRKILRKTNKCKHCGYTFESYDDVAVN